MSSVRSWSSKLAVTAEFYHCLVFQFWGPCQTCPPRVAPYLMAWFLQAIPYFLAVATSFAPKRLHRSAYRRRKSLTHDSILSALKNDTGTTFYPLSHPAPKHFCHRSNNAVLGQIFPMTAAITGHYRIVYAKIMAPRLGASQFNIFAVQLYAPTK